MDVVTVLGELGGVTSRKPLLRRVTRGDLERAVAAGEVVRVTRGRYALPTDDRARASAHRLTGTAVLVTAAAHWKWARMWEPRQPTRPDWVAAMIAKAVAQRTGVGRVARGMPARLGDARLPPHEQLGVRPRGLSTDTRCGVQTRSDLVVPR